MNMQSNILKWYPFERKSKIFEIHCGTSLFKNDNVDFDLTSCDYRNFRITEKYDYIMLIGTYEYAPIITDLSNPYVGLLKELKRHLNDNGKILLAIDNRMGTKYLVGGKSELYTRIFEGLENNVPNTGVKLLTKQEIITQICDAGFNFYKFFYPLPDYNSTNVIYSDLYIPKSNHSKILYSTKYDDKSVVLYNETKLIKQICDLDVFDKFANSFFVEISNEMCLNQITFVSFNHCRKDKYKTILTISDNEVKKIAENSLAQRHIDDIGWNINRLKELNFDILDKYVDGIIKSEFFKGDELDKIIVKLLQEEKADKATKTINSWYKYIGEKLTGQKKDDNESIFQHFKIVIPDSVNDKFTYIRDGFIDLSFENTFFKDNYVFYDQEWYYKNVPLEFILFRAINNLYAYHCQEIEKCLSKEEMFKTFNLVDYISYFEALERLIQKDILDDKSTKKNNNCECYRKIEDLKEKEDEIKIYKKMNDKLKDELSYLEKEYKKLAKERKILNDNFLILSDQKERIETEYLKMLDEYNNSKGWKIIKGIRKIIRKG